jgi:DNA-binding CsgD family transcriptional regulator
MKLDPTMPVSEELVREFLGRLAGERRATRGADPTSFLMDRELVCQAAAGESILRLPWFDDGLFVGRQLPDITEMPAAVRSLAQAHYRAALTGEPGRYAFVSYGHAYSVDAVPVHDASGRITAVLGVATPTRRLPGATVAYERTRERLERTAAVAEQRADWHRANARHDDEAVERDRACRFRKAAGRARAQAELLTTGGGGVAPVALTSREADVLVLVSHGLTAPEIAEQLVVSQGTVRTHLENIYGKLGVGDRAAAVATALRHGLID